MFYLLICSLSLLPLPAPHLHSLRKMTKLKTTFVHLKSMKGGEECSVNDAVRGKATFLCKHFMPFGCLLAMGRGKRVEISGKVLLILQRHFIKLVISRNFIITTLQLMRSRTERTCSGSHGDGNELAGVLLS